jgi:hypothetical protein
VRRRHGIWTAPVAIAALSVFGLAAGLLGDGVWDWVAAGALAVPVAVGAWHWSRPPVSPHR